MMTSLSPRDRNTIQELRRQDVQQTLAGAKRFARFSRWLAANNRYAHDTTKKIDAEMRTGRIKNPRDLSQYIAASGLLHCTDGWSYLGKAISCLTRGDPHRARHLAYYAELRAAMSLLATEGIGVFNKRHFVVTAPNSVGPLASGAPTHQFV